MGVEPCILTGVVASLIMLKVTAMIGTLIQVHAKIVSTVDFHLNFGWAVGMGDRLEDTPPM